MVDDQLKSWRAPPSTGDISEPLPPRDQDFEENHPELLSEVPNAPLSKPDRLHRAHPEPSQSPPRSFAMTGLFLLACIYTLYFAAELLMPIAVAFVLFLILSPVLRVLIRLKVPEPVGAAAIVLGLVGTFVVGFYFLSGPATQWISELPKFIDTLEAKFREPVEQIQRAKEEIESAFQMNRNKQQDATGPVASEADNKANTPPSESKRPEEDRGMSFGLLNIVTTVIASLGSLGGTLIVIFALLFFLLATGERYQEKIVKALPTLRDKKRAVVIIRRVHHDVAKYLLSVTIINCVLGCAIGFGLHLVGMPNAVLWGVMAAALNFIPYLGALVGEAIVGIVGLAVFSEPLNALKPVAVYMVLNTLEGQFVTPAILGRRLTINPLIVFLAVLFWGWLWGVPGALLAVPLLACFKAICDATDKLRPISEFLGR